MLNLLCLISNLFVGITCARLKPTKPSQDLKLEETTPTISYHALVNISIIQTLKSEGYIKK